MAATVVGVETSMILSAISASFGSDHVEVTNVVDAITTTAAAVST